MTTLFAIAIFLYFLGTIKYLLHLGMRSKIAGILAVIMIVAGFIAHTAALAELSMLTGHGPYTNSFEQLLFGAWATFGVFLVAELYLRMKPLGAFMAPVGLLLMLLAVVLSGQTESDLPVKAYWLTIHRTVSFVSFGAFALVFAAGVMYLIQERQLKAKRFGAWYHRLPSLSRLDDANRIGIYLGFPLITIGMVAATVWSARQYGIFLKGDISVVLLLMAWAIFALSLAGRVMFGWRGRRSALLGVTGFAVILVSLIRHLS